MKKLFAALVALALLLTACALAEDELDHPSAPAETSGDWEYRVLENGTAEITGYNGNAETLEIPSQLDGHAVTSIGDGAFFAPGILSLTSVTIPDSVKETGVNPFEACLNLTEIKVSPEHEYLAVIDGALISKPDMRLVCCPMNIQGVYAIPQGVREIGDNAFLGCDSLTSVTIPEGVTSIEDWAFYGCDSLTSVTIPEGVTSIGYEAFAWCDALTSVTIPSSVTFIGERAFAVCADELTLTVPKDSCAEEYCRDNDLKYICPETSDR